MASSADFDQAKRSKVTTALRALFKGVSKSARSSNTMIDIRNARANEISKAEFKSLKWADVEKIIGKEIMKSRFHGDGDNSVDMEKVWMKLDTNSDSTLTPEEFLAECLDESYCSMAEAMEAYEIIRDQNDELPVENLGDAIRAIGLNPTSQQVTEMANKYDDNADGSIDREEWKKIVGDMMKFPKDDRKTLMKAFEKVAKGGKGAQAQISTEELVYVATKLGHRLDAKEVEEMIKTVDANSDGQVQFSEFITMVQMLPAYADGEL